MYLHGLDTPIEYLKGVGPERAKSLKKELNIHIYEDLINHYPFRYIDRTEMHSVSQLTADSGVVQLIGKISNVDTVGEKRAKRLTAVFSDGTGVLNLVWFQGIKWVKPQITNSEKFLVYGKINAFKGRLTITHPEIEAVSAENASGLAKASLQPVYSTTDLLTRKGLHSKGIARLAKALMPIVDQSLKETLPATISEILKLGPRKVAIKNIHFPSDKIAYQKAQYYLKFEELFFIQIRLLKLKKNRQLKHKGFVFVEVGNYFKAYYNEILSFELTNAQKRVVKEIRKDLGSGKQMNRLLQGDVGSGKTVVSLLIMLIAIDNNFQAVLMAPTEILAQQHFKSLASDLEKVGVGCAILTGSTKQAERKIIHEELLSGKIKVIIGTHALIEDTVQFKNLGLIVIDEQHKFGVAQRAKLWAKNKNGIPHVLVMTATPIPRTLAMTLYGDLDTSIIDELPPGRKPVKTIHQYEKHRAKVFGFLKEQVDKGRQAYVVYPLIEESETLDYNYLMDGYESISRMFPLPEYKIGILHGRMKPEDKEIEMQKFARGETHIMVSTTVIEVGVNVPNSTIMVIENAEKFGLSQLHQLRGRVGRGAEQSFCILLSSYKLSLNAKVRLETMCRTNNGFEVAESDLKLRGPGDMMGTQQSGITDLKISNLVTDGKILGLAREMAQKILEEDPSLEKHPLLLNELQRKKKRFKNWSRIS